MRTSLRFDLSFSLCEGSRFTAEPLNAALSSRSGQAPLRESQEVAMLVPARFCIKEYTLSTPIVWKKSQSPRGLS